MNRKDIGVIVKNKKRARKLSVQIGYTFFSIIIVMLGILALVGYFLVKNRIAFVNRYSFSFIIVWIIGGICMTVSFLGAYYIMTKVFEPLEKLSEASKQVAKGNFDVQVAYNGDIEELGSTIENFNIMVKELNSVEIMRNDFVADVSHEFKTPLSAITGYATFLQDMDLSQREREDYIRKIFFNVDKLNDLTENILRLSKLEHQQFLDAPLKYRLDEQLREVIVLLEPKWSIKKIKLDLQLPEVIYTGQKGLLFQVWMNVIGNAIKYLDENGLMRVYLKENDDHYEIMVGDNGIGMSEETQQHIFDKFYQADTSRKAQGNGLGLALCREIIDKCNGKIVVESQLGIGSVFMIQLPKNNNFE